MRVKTAINHLCVVFQKTGLGASGCCSPADPRLLRLPPLLPPLRLSQGRFSLLLLPQQLSENFVKEAVSPLPLTSIMGKRTILGEVSSWETLTSALYCCQRILDSEGLALNPGSPLPDM